jgi:TIR domain
MSTSGGERSQRGREVRFRAFFSHSSRDADLVRAVGRAVGRPFVLIDYFAFQTGDELLEVIHDAIDAAAIFVLFVSREALGSDWVAAEVEDARQAFAIGRLRSVLVYITDTRIASNDLPEWLRAFKYTYSNAVQPIARDIRGRIDEMVRERQTTFFVGRRREVEMLQDQVVPPDGSEGRSILAVTGLTGIGRETLLARVARDLLTIRRAIRVEVESGDLLNDLSVKLAHLVESITSLDDARSLGRYRLAARLTGEDAWFQRW